MMLNTTFLRSRVARRIFVLFVACALVPMAVFTSISFVQVSSQLSSQNRRQLQQAAKSLGLAIYERLTILDADLQVTALRIQHGDPITSPKDQSRFLRSTVWKNGETPAGSFQPALSATEIAHLSAGKALVRVDTCSDPKGGECVLMMRWIDVNNPRAGLIAGEVNPDYLWSGDRLPIDIDLMIHDAGANVLYNSNPARVPASVIPSLRSSEGFVSWTSHGAAYEGAYRDLFLRAEFSAGTWTVMVSQNRQNAFIPMRHFRETLLLVALLAGWIVLLFSLIQIRRTMGPLEKLGEGTKQIAEQNFEARVEISSGDEFEDLAASFNSMSSRLGRQFHTLRAINDIDQAILSSLNRESVVRTALSRISTLLPGECFAIVIFQPNASNAGSAQVTVCEPRTGLQQTFVDRMALPEELQELQQRRGRQIRLEPGRTPDFLSPLQSLGMTSASVFPITLDRKLFGALVSGNSTSAEMTAEDAQHATQVADQLAVAFSNVQLVEAMEQLHWGTLTALARAIDAKSAWTAGHSERVTQLALKIGSAMGLSPRDLQIMHRGGLLHDIGKIGTAPEILEKPGTLGPKEMEHMRDHVRTGIRILEPIAAFAEAIPIVAQHHEWFNGQGYPEGLAGEEISLHARIFAVADCYDALVSDRPYRKGLPRRKVIEMIREKSGTQFDPKVVDTFVRLCSEDEPRLIRRNEGRLVKQTV